ncbi:MAG: fibrobacter succinogenes major paralogous domain-containing protein, partial [bacterium]
GQLLGVEKMLAGSVSKVGDVYSVELRLIDVGSGKIEKSDSYDMQGNIGQLLTSGMKNALEILIGIAQPQNQIKSLSVTEKPLKPQNTTPISLTIGTLTDIDGNEYKTVKIGNQWWMAENLKVTHYRNGDAIPNVTDTTEWSNLTTGAYCNYNNDDNNTVTYGSLYNWYTVNDSRNIAPEGWHAPSDKEWKELEMYLGMGESDANSIEVRGTYEEGGNLKSTSGWYNSGNGTDDFGFSALPGGSCRNGTFYYMGRSAYFWSSTEGSSSTAWHRGLPDFDSFVWRSTTDKRGGLSVRLVRD